MMMEKAEHLAKQHKVLDVFYKEYFKKTNMHFGYWLAAGFLLGFSGLIALIPYQALSADDKAMIVMVVVAQLSGINLYLSAYRTSLSDRGMITPLYSRLKYLPISAEIVRKYHFNKAFKLQNKIYVAVQSGQLFFSIVTQHEVVFGNIWYPLLSCWMIPCVFLLVISFTVKQ